MFLEKATGTCRGVRKQHTVGSRCRCSSTHGAARQTLSPQLHILPVFLAIVAAFGSSKTQRWLAPQDAADRGYLVNLETPRGPAGADCPWRSDAGNGEATTRARGIGCLIECCTVACRGGDEPSHPHRDLERWRTDDLPGADAFHRPGRPNRSSKNSPVLAGRS